MIINKIKIEIEIETVQCPFLRFRPSEIFAFLLLPLRKSGP